MANSKDSTQDPPVDDVIRDLAVAECAARGVAVVVARHEEGYQLTLPDGYVMFLVNVTRIAKGAAREQWPALVAQHIAAHLGIKQQTPPEGLTREELRTRVMTRLVGSDKDRWVDHEYARAFAPGVVQVLCVDYPQTVATLSDRSIPQMAMTLDEMYEQGQKNTDAEALDRLFQIDEYVHGLAGDSLFVASKAANFRALVPDVIGPAPLGVAFALPNRGLMLYSIITQDDWMVQLMQLTHVIDSIAFDPDFHHPGGLISRYAYYWAPDGTVERIGGRYFALDGKPTISILPTGKFSQYVRVGASTVREI